MVRTVLSVEDDDATHFLLDIAFQEMGPDFRLYRVTDALEALQFLSHTGPFTDSPRPDLILSNLNMPGMGGIELLRRIQNDNRWKDIPVVVFSSSKLESDRAKCLALGAKHYISKPAAYRDFMSAVKTACGYADGTITASVPG